MGEPVDLENPYESSIIEGWCAGLVALAEAARSLGADPEVVIEKAKQLGLKLPQKWDVELFRIRDVNYRSNHEEQPYLHLDGLGATMPDEKTIRIRNLNDELRTRGHALNGRVVIMGGLTNEKLKKQISVALAAGQHTDWNSGDDPYGEHDFGKFTVDGEAFIFKIDYYSLDELHGSKHPEDQKTTIRVMTLMYAEDY